MPLSAFSPSRLVDPRFEGPSVISRLLLTALIGVCRVHNPPDGPHPQRNGKFRPDYGVLEPPLGIDAAPCLVDPQVSEMNERSRDAGAVLGENDAGVVVAVAAVNADLFYPTLPRQLGLLGRKGDADLVAAYAGRCRSRLGGRGAIVHGIRLGIVAPLLRGILLGLIVTTHAVMVAAGAGPFAV